MDVGEYFVDESMEIAKVETRDENNKISINWPFSLEEISNVEDLVEMHGPKNYNRRIPLKPGMLSCIFHTFTSITCKAEGKH